MKMEKQPGETAGILRKLLVVVLIFVFLLTIGSLWLRSSISQKLASLSTKLQIPPETGRISDVLLELNSAENDFQQASLYGFEDKLDEYQRKLDHIFQTIDLVLKEYPSLKGEVDSKEEALLKNHLQGKLTLSMQVFALKKSFDSLLTDGAKDTLLNKGTIISLPGARKEVVHTSSPDTLSQNLASASKKKGFFKRVQEVFSPGTDSVYTKMLLVTKERAMKDSITKELQLRNELGQRKLLEKLNKEHSLLGQSQQHLISANLSLVLELRQLIDQVKDNYLAIWEDNQRHNLKLYENTVHDLDRFTVVAILMVLVFVGLLLFYIKRLGEAEGRYRAENARAVALAEQKSEMLATMSHEIRNPLTAITGFVHLMKRTVLSDDQKRMVASIQSSSDMLMGTVNDILDMTKVESQQSDVLKSVSFIPYRELDEAIETMRFIAIRKQISLTFHFEGKQEMEVYGDPFRLKQVVINLVGNAIKYTDQGGVEVGVMLKNEGGQPVLAVAVRDSGIGIPADKQGKLFTKYYQADRENSRPGTGLGLYICYQLIKLQKGAIQVKSEEGKGSIFSFTIPYRSTSPAL